MAAGVDGAGFRRADGEEGGNGRRVGRWRLVFGLPSSVARYAFLSGALPCCWSIGFTPPRDVASAWIRAVVDPLDAPALL